MIESTYSMSTYVKAIRTMAFEKIKTEKTEYIIWIE